MTRIGFVMVAWLGAIALLGCSSSGASESGAAWGDDDGASGGYGGGAYGTGGYQATGGLVIGTGGVTPPPPEEEVENQFRTPVSTGHFLWTANPVSSYVAAIDTAAPALTVQILEAGYGPTTLASVVTDPNDEDDNATLVLNAGSIDATLLRLDAAGGVTRTTYPTHPGANALAVSGGGRWAIAWTDASLLDAPDVTEGCQEVTVLSLTGTTAQRLSVGYRPVSIAFDTAETRAYVVHGEGISVIDLGANPPAAIDLIALGEDPTEDPDRREVSITPDGSLALVRRTDDHLVTLITLATGASQVLDLVHYVTDLDVSEDGSRAVAVTRWGDLSEVVIIDLPGGALTTLSQQAAPPFGSASLSPDGTTALLYLTATPSDRLTILELSDPPTWRTVSVGTPVAAVFPAPDGRNAITLQAPAAGSTRAGAFSVVPIDAEIQPRIEGTDAAPMAQGVAVDPLGAYALVTVRDDTARSYGVYLITLATRRVDLITLSSAPLATGIVRNTRKGYVAQEHPDGRVTILDFNQPDGAPRTITGFELAARAAR